MQRESVNKNYKIFEISEICIELNKSKIIYNLLLFIFILKYRITV